MSVGGSVRCVADSEQKVARSVDQERDVCRRTSMHSLSSPPALMLGPSPLSITRFVGQRYVGTPLAPQPTHYYRGATALPSPRGSAGLPRRPHLGPSIAAVPQRMSSFTLV